MRPINIFAHAFLAFGLALTTVSFPAAAGISAEVTARGHVAFHGDQTFYYDAVAEIEADLELSKNWRLVLISKSFLDGRDQLEPGRPAQSLRSAYTRRLSLGEQAEIEMRELYLAGPTGRVFWTIGKQQIVWGKADGVRVLDIVNPHTFREFILRDFDESRIPLWSIKAEAAIGPLTFESVFVPDETYAEIAPRGGIFELSSFRFGPPIPTQPSGRNVVKDSVNDSPGYDYGGRASAFVGGWDLSLIYFRHTEDAPSFSVRNDENSVAITPFRNRAHLVGGSFANAYGDFAIRGELGYKSNPGVSTVFDAPTRSEHALNKSLSYVVGLDWYGLKNSLITVQFYQDRIIGTLPANRPRNDAIVTIGLRRTFSNERVTLKARTLYGVEESDVMVQGSLDFQLRDNFGLFTELVYFSGNSDGVFGQFEKASRLTNGIRLSF